MTGEADPLHLFSCQNAPIIVKTICIKYFKNIVNTFHFDLKTLAKCEMPFIIPLKL